MRKAMPVPYNTEYVGESKKDGYKLLNLSIKPFCVTKCLKITWDDSKNNLLGLSSILRITGYTFIYDALVEKSFNGLFL